MTINNSLVHYDDGDGHDGDDEEEEEVEEENESLDNENNGHRQGEKKAKRMDFLLSGWALYTNPIMFLDALASHRSIAVVQNLRILGLNPRNPW